jgi:NADP-dependent 3-hydroxy acid dehydrogenase YdfG
LGDIDSAAVEGTATKCGGVAFRLDVTDPASWRAFRAGVEEQLGGIDVLVNNAGIMPIAEFVDETDTTTRRMLDTNVLGVLLGCRAVLPGMLARRRGHLINIASMAGVLGISGAVTYCATKFAVVGATQALADELCETPVSVTCVLPGIVNTELSVGFPTGRLVPHVEPSDVAEAVVAAVASPRGQVWVPASGRASFRLAGLIPSGPRHRLLRMCGLDNAVLGVDRAVRAGYEARIAGTAVEESGM